MNIAPGQNDLQGRWPLIKEFEQVSKGQRITPHRPIDFIKDHQIKAAGVNPLPRNGKGPLHTGSNFLFRDGAGDHPDPGIDEVKTGETTETGQLAGWQGGRLEQAHPEDLSAMTEGAGSQTGRSRRLPFSRTGIDL